MSTIRFSPSIYGLSEMEDTITMDERVCETFKAKYIDGDNEYPISAAVKMFDKELGEDVVVIMAHVGWLPTKNGDVRHIESVDTITKDTVGSYVWDDEKLILTRDKSRNTEFDMLHF